MQSGVVLFEQQDRVATLTLNRPEARNAINGEVATAIEAALDRIEDDDDLWVTILTGAGPAFSAGADLKAVNEGKGASLQTERGGFAGLVKRSRTKPLIAAVDGPALAGGCEIALACDLIVASTAARFGLPEVKRSLVASSGGLFRLPQVLPPKVAMELILTGDPISAERAHALGMINVLVEPGQVLTAARQLADRITVNAPIAVRHSRAVALGVLEGQSEDQLWEASGAAMAKVARTEDYREGPLAFIQKRQPQWKGR